MVRAELSVVTYTPRAKSMAHWAIYLRIINGDKDKIQNIIYQANGEEGDLELSILEADPNNSRSLEKQIDIGDIDDEGTISEIKDMLENHPMNNELPTWNCQDWVMEVLEALDNEGLLSDEYQYQDAKDILNDLYHE